METEDAKSDSSDVSETVFEIGKEVGLTREQVMLLPVYSYADMVGMSVHYDVKYIANMCKAPSKTIQRLFERVRPNIAPGQFAAPFDLLLQYCYQPDSVKNWSCHQYLLLATAEPTSLSKEAHLSLELIDRVQKRCGQLAQVELDRQTKLESL